MRAARLGDDIDDFCVKCKRVMNHAVVSLLNDAPAKVRCRTCHSDHDYRHEQAPPPKVDPRKAALYFNQQEQQQVLEKVTGVPAPVLEAPVVEAPVLEGKVAAEPEANAAIAAAADGKAAEASPIAKTAAALDWENRRGARRSKAESAARKPSA